MRTLFAVLVLLATLPIPSAAQSLYREIDLSKIILAKDVTAEPVDTDGNPFTEEWLVKAASGQCGDLPCDGFAPLGSWYIVVEVREYLVFGEWFLAGSTPTAKVSIGRFGNVDKLIVNDWPNLTIFNLDRPYYSTSRFGQ